MSSLHIHKDFFAEAFWKKLNGEMKSFLKRVEFIEICYTSESSTKTLVESWENIPEGIRKRMANRILQGDAGFLRESRNFSNVFGGLYSGMNEEDLPLYNKKGDSDKLFYSTKKLYPKDLASIKGWSEFFKTSVLPFQAWILEDNYFELRGNTIPLMKELIKSPSGMYRPGIIFLTKSKTKKEAEDRFNLMEGQFRDTFQKSTSELGISILFNKKIHARQIYTNTCDITISNSTHAFWDDMGTFHLRTANDYIQSIPGFVQNTKNEEGFDSIREYVEILLRSKPRCFGYLNWRETLERHFVKTS